MTSTIHACCFLFTASDWIVAIDLSPDVLKNMMYDTDEKMKYSCLQKYKRFAVLQYWKLVGRDQNLRESSVIVNSRFTISGNREIREWQLSLFLVILSEKLANFCMISRQIVKITGIGREQDFTI